MPIGMESPHRVLRYNLDEMLNLLTAKTSQLESAVTAMSARVDALVDLRISSACRPLKDVVGAVIKEQHALVALIVKYAVYAFAAVCIYNAAATLSQCLIILIIT